MTTTRTTQEPGQFAGDAPLTGHHIQGHSINVILAKGVPEEVLRSSVTHFGTRGLFGKPIRRTSRHDRDNVRRKRWRVAQSSKTKVKPNLSHQLEDDGGRDHEGASGYKKRVMPSVPNTIDSTKTPGKLRTPPLAPPVPSLLPNYVESSSSSPYSTDTHLPAGCALTDQTHLRSGAFLGLASDGSRSTSANYHSYALALPVTLVGQVRRTLGAFGSHTPPTAAVTKRHMDTPSIALKNPHGSSNVVVHMAETLRYPTQSQIVGPPSVGARDSTPMETTVWTTTHLERDPRHLYVPATATSGALRSHQGRGPAGKGPENPTGVQRACGPIRATRATFYQHAPSPYPSLAHRFAAGRAHLNHSPTTAKGSAIARCANAATGAHQAQVRQSDPSTIQAHAPHDNAKHLSTKTFPALVNSISQPQFSALTATTATNTQQRSQCAPTSASAYSELAQALVDHHSVASPAGPAGAGTSAVYPPLSIPQARSGAITSPTASVPGAVAWRAYEQNGLPITPPLVLDYPSTGPAVDAAVAPGISRAHATGNGWYTARNFEGPFEGCEPFWQGIMAPPALAADVTNRQDTDETHLGLSLFASGNDFHHQLQTTLTWEEACSNSYYPYLPCLHAQPPA